MSDDRDLHERFDSMRRADEARATSFERVVEAVHARRVRLRVSLVPIALATAVLAALGIVVIRSLDSPLPRGAESLAEWTAPTDFLLRTPGSALLLSAPVFVPPKMERSLPP